jgi:uncharacterized membrane protein
MASYIRSEGVIANRAVLALSKHWLLLVNVLLGIFVGLPWLAPVLMAHGYERLACVIYCAYSLTCHQLPQRSYFLFGRKLVYSMEEIRAVWPWSDIWTMRQFIGTREMGYKVAYSDRMVSMYMAMFVGSLVFGLVRRWLRPLSLKWFVLVGVLPIFIDGNTHLISEVSLTGFRENNAWLAWLTGNVFTQRFYIGDAIGSFNWWMRLITGLLFGFTLVWLILPYLERGMAEIGVFGRAILHQSNP